MWILYTQIKYNDFPDFCKTTVENEHSTYYPELAGPKSRMQVGEKNSILLSRPRVMETMIAVLQIQIAERTTIQDGFSSLNCPVHIALALHES